MVKIPHVVLLALNEMIEPKLEERLTVGVPLLHVSRSLAC